MDSFEDFEFKPLTDGLGFHKKTGSSATTKSTNPDETVKASKDLPKLVDFDLPEIQPKNFKQTFSDSDYSEKQALEQKVKELPIEAPQDTQSLFTQKPLPREGEVREISREKKQALQVPKFQGPKFAKSLNEKTIIESTPHTILENKLDFATPTSNRIDTQIRYKYTEEAPSLLSIFLDSTVIAGLAILFMLSLALTTGVDVVSVMSTKMDLGTQVGIFLLVFSVSQLYYILSRVFFGQTLGEWSLEHQVGLKEEQEKLSYIFKLILRSLVSAVTGFIVLPILSQIMKKDIAGRISKLMMYRQDQI